MKIKHKKLAASGTAIVLAGVLGVGALLQTSVSVQASSVMMPGIEEIVNDTAGSSEPFKILEIVDKKEEAELGYYISGQEPYIKLYEYHYQDSDGNERVMTFETLEDGLSKLPEKERYEFAQNVKLNDDGSINTDESTGIKNVQNVSYRAGVSEGNDAEYPLSYTQYQEKYFLDANDNEKDWKSVDFVDADGKSRTDTVSLEGTYQENPAGTGNYTKEEQVYYPIRKNNQEDQNRTDKYRENIENFYYSDSDTAQAPYFLEFEPVSNTLVNDAIDNKQQDAVIGSEYAYNEGKYGYYENVYADLTEDMVKNIDARVYTFPGETPEKPANFENDSLLVQSNISTQTDAFSAGTEAEFSSVNEENATTDVAADFGNGQDNGFSDGDFSSGTEEGIGDAVDAASAPQTAADSSSSDGNLSDGTQNEENSVQQAVGGISDKENQGKQSDPYIYLSENIDKYPYYKYTLFGDLNYVKDKVKECRDRDETAQMNQTTITRKEGDITLENGQYWYWQTNELTNDFDKLPLSIVTGRQAVPYSDVQKIDTNIITYDYYYRVKVAYFCCVSKDTGNKPDDFQYFGWYYPSYPQNQDVYIKVNEGDNKVPTYYISDAEYKLTPGKGEFDFVPGGTEKQSVQVNHVYYKGGYTNHDWFKRYVFHLSPEDSDETVRKQFDNFNIEVTTMTTKEFNETYGNGTVSTDTGSADTATATDDAVAEDSNENDSAINSDEVEADIDTELNAEQDNIPDTTEQSEESETSEVDSMVSEAGVELVSIENEISDNATDEFQDGTDTTGDTDEMQQEEASEVNGASADLSDIPFSDGESEGTNTFSAGESSDQAGLSGYDLVYINGILSVSSFEKLASLAEEKNLPCIVNQVKLAENSNFTNAFSELINNEDEDKHYVNTCVYFFKNTLQTENQGNLLNTLFDTNFNPEAGDGAFSSEDQIKGFEEILEYIESENKYRSLDQADRTEFTSKDTENPDISDGTVENPSETITPLAKEISQARAIEYIINYKYKRNTNQKQDIKVLEIMPDENCSQIDDNTVIQWLSDKNTNAKEIQYAVNESATSNCWHGINKNTWNPDSPGNAIDNNPNTMWHSRWESDEGFSECRNHEHYLEVTLKEASTVNGFEYTGRSNADAGVLTKYRAEFYNSEGQLIDSTDLRSTGINASNYQTIGKVKLSFGKTVTDVSKVRVYFSETLDTKGFASCVQINFFYAPHAIYPEVTHMTASEFAGHIDDIGSEYDMIYIGDKKTSEDHSLITGGGEFRYVHVGNAVGIESKDQNLLKLLGQLDTDYLSNDRTKFAPYSTYNENGSGYFHGSGNDMTEQQYNMLMEFVKSGYPVILADGLVSGKKANSKEVDTSSYYSQFISNILTYDNVYLKSVLDSKGDKELSFFSNLAKPVIDFGIDGKPVEPKRLNESAADGNDADYYISDKLEYTFTVRNDSDALPATTSYDCNLYIDLNFDGNYSRDENQSKYIEIKDSDGNVLSRNGSSQYELKVGKKYTLTRKIPSDYFKIISWKLELTSNRNAYIHTSEIGYAKQKGDSKNKQVINVVQLVPDRCTWLLSGNDNGKSMFETYMEKVEDFKLNLTIVYVKDINDGNYGQGYSSMEDLLKDQQMLIIGFADVYTDIKMDNVKAILNFIRSGRSVIFSHDTTSYVNYDYNKMDKNIPKDNYNSLGDAYTVPYDNFLQNTAQNVTWGLSLNTILRSVTGMDRYGITSDEKIKGTETELGTLLKQGNVLHDGATVNFADLLELAGDVAYRQNDKSSSYAQTQGYSNALLMNKLGEHSWNATKVNDGAITQYPYKIKDNISIAETHGQYYQLALEQDRDINKKSDGCNDVVVWYCLPRGAYGSSTNDVRNDYYFYSKGNVIYTGAGHSTIDNVDEIQLFINAIVAAANVTAVKPEVSFVKSLNPTAETETTRYYMTDQTSWTGSENTLEEDMDFYINIKDYNMASSELTQEDLNGQKMTVEFYMENAKGDVLTDDVENLPDQLKTKRVIPLDENISYLSIYGNSKDVIKLGSDNKFYITNNNAYGLSVKKIEQLLKNSDGSYNSNCKIWVKVSSTVSLYGKLTTKTSWASVNLNQRQLFELD